MWLVIFDHFNLFCQKKFPTSTFPTALKHWEISWKLIFRPFITKNRLEMRLEI